jgi:hypothetical protein
LFCNSDESPNSVKYNIGLVLRTKVLESQEWRDLRQNTYSNLANGNNKCGNHSLHKFALTLTRLLCWSQDEVDVRGRWRNIRCVSDRYTSNHLPIVDANVAAALAIGGAVKYKIIADSNVTHNW